MQHAIPLSLTEAVHYLLEQGLLSSASVVDGDLAAVDKSRRNHNIAVSCEPGASYLIKQAIGPDRIATLAREAATYRVLQREAAVRSAIPRLCAYDAGRHLLVLSLVREPETLREHHARTGRFSTRAAATLGDKLAAVHALPAECAPSPCDLPWVFSLRCPPLAFYRDLSGASIEALRVAQHSTELCQQLARQAETWNRKCLVHFDLRWDNCVLSPRQKGAGPELKLVDWELAGAGDPAWDVGCAFAEYLACWVSAMPLSADSPGQLPMLPASRDLKSMRPAIAAFWRGYADHQQQASRLLLRAVELSGARLVQIAIERMQSASRLTRAAVCLLQLGSNLLRRPLEASAVVLGLPLSA